MCVLPAKKTPHVICVPRPPRYGCDRYGYFNLHGVPWLVALSLVCWFAPGPLELFRRYGAALGPEGGEFSRERRWAPAWAPTGRWAVVVAAVGFVAVTFMARVTEFIYYQF